MKTQHELNQIDIDIDYYDAESIVRGFLLHSALNRMHEFSFEDAFNQLRNPIDYKLIEHAQNCTLEEYTDYNCDMGLYCNTDFEKFTFSTDYIHIDIDDVKEAINKLHYEKCKEAFDGMFDDLIEIQEELNNVTDDQEHNVILFDRVIHAQHVTGDIFDDLDIDAIKSDLDDEIIEMMGINV